MPNRQAHQPPPVVDNWTPHFNELVADAKATGDWTRAVDAALGRYTEPDYPGLDKALLQRMYDTYLARVGVDQAWAAKYLTGEGIDASNSSYSDELKQAAPRLAAMKALL
jgi:hypothetical protein